MTRPDTKYSTTGKGDHRLRAIQGNFGELLWKCELCGEEYTETDYYDNNCPGA